MAIDTNRIEITSEALKWRELDPREIKEENIERIGAIAIGIITLIGSVFAIIYLPSFYAGFAAFLGGAIGCILIGRGVVVDYEKAKNDYRSIIDLSTNLQRDEVATQLTTDSLQQSFNHFYQKLGPLVRKGMLTVEQGTEMRNLFKDIANDMETINEYENSDILSPQIANGARAQYPHYDQALRHIETQDWQSLQQRIQRNFVEE